FMHPLVITASNDQTLFRPNDLGPNGEALLAQAIRYCARMQGRVPDVRDIPGEERPSVAPVVPLIIANFPDPRRLAKAPLVAPGWIIFNTVRRVGHHEIGFGTSQEGPDKIGICAVPARDAVGAQ